MEGDQEGEGGVTKGVHAGVVTFFLINAVEVLFPGWSLLELRGCLSRGRGREAVMSVSGIGEWDEWDEPPGKGQAWVIS